MQCNAYACGISLRNDWSKKELEEDYVSKMTATTVPVNIGLEGKQQILDLSEMKRILSEATIISLGVCGCRKDLGRCHSPLDVCLSLDKEAEVEVEKGLARKVSLREALDALRRSHNAGLVHLAYVFKGNDKPEVICSCCSCCCHSMSALVRFGIPEAVVASKFIAKQDVDTCVDCGTCVKRCQFKARYLQEGKLVYDSAKCFGCGLCMSTCPTKAISLAERS